MYKYFGFGLMGFFIFMMVPGIDQTIEQSKMYGVATLVAYDLERNEIFSQTVHNRLVDTGEDLINHMVFSDGLTAADDDVVGSICIYDEGTAMSTLDVETTTAAQFDSPNANTLANCRTDDAVSVVNGTSTAVIGPLTFAGGVNLNTGGVVNGLGVCQAHNTNANFTGCATEGDLFAIVDTSDVTLGLDETVDITYTFSLVSPNN